MKVLVLLSGGIDSVTALYHVAKTEHVLGSVSIDYGSKHNQKELACAAWHADQVGVAHHVVPLPFVNELFQSDLLLTGGDIPDGHYEDVTMRQTVVPFRNGIMLSIAAGLAESLGAGGVVIGAHAGDHAIYPDCREAFMSAMADAIRLGTYEGIELMCPFVNQTKGDIVSLGHAAQIDYSQTWSCYKGLDLHCGTCGTCVERREAFELAGISDPTPYINEPVLPKSAS